MAAQEHGKSETPTTADTKEHGRKIRALALSSESTLTEGFHVANRQGLLFYSVVLCALCGKGLVFSCLSVSMVGLSLHEKEGSAGLE
jgi:hypothetical protein